MKNPMFSPDLEVITSERGAVGCACCHQLIAGADLVLGGTASFHTGFPVPGGGKMLVPIPPGATLGRPTFAAPAVNVCLRCLIAATARVAVATAQPVGNVIVALHDAMMIGPPSAPPLQKGPSKRAAKRPKSKGATRAQKTPRKSIDSQPTKKGHRRERPKS